MRKGEALKIVSFLKSRLFIVLVFVAIIFLLFSLARSYFQEQQIKEEIEILKKESQLLEIKKFETLEILKYVQSSDFIEEKARTEFNMQKIGEKLVIIKSLTEKEPVVGQEKEKMISYSPIYNLKKWWNLFTNY